MAGSGSFTTISGTAVCRRRREGGNSDAAGTAERGWSLLPGSSLDSPAAATNACHPGPRAGIVRLQAYSVGGV